MTTPTNDPTAELAERVARLANLWHENILRGGFYPLADEIAAELRPLVEALEAIEKELNRSFDSCREENDPTGPWLTAGTETRLRQALAAARSGKEGGA